MWTAIPRLVRLPNAVTAASNVIAGHGVTAALGGSAASATAVALAATAGAFFYAFGMALNDLVDRHRDAILHPERPIPAGEIRVGTARVVVGLSLAAAIVLACAADIRLLGVAALLVGAVIAYDVVLKRRPVAASVAMGACRAACVCLGVVLAISDEPDGLATAAILRLPASYLLLITTITAVSSFEDGALTGTSFRPLLAVLFCAIASPMLLTPAEPLVPAIIVLLLGGWAVAPGLSGTPAPGLVVRNTIFMLPLFDAAWLLAAGRLEGAGICAALYLSSRVIGRSIALRTS